MVFHNTTFLLKFSHSRAVVAPGFLLEESQVVERVSNSCVLFLFFMYRLLFQCVSLYTFFLYQYARLSGKQMYGCSVSHVNNFELLRMYLGVGSYYQVIGYG